MTRSRPPVRPALEALEARLAPAAFTVDRSTDVSEGSGFTGSLRYCLNQANAMPGADTITIATTQPIVLESQLQITDTVSITGAAGSSLIERDSNASAFGLFDITASAGKVILSNLELTGGNAPGTGGAVSNAADLTLQNCYIHDNTAPNPDGSAGGGIFTTGMLTVTGSTIQRNSAGQGAGIYSTNAPGLTITGSVISDNIASGDGGGVYVTSATSPLQISNTLFVGNSAFGSGGGLFLSFASQRSPALPPAVDAIVSGTTFQDNQAAEAGGVFSSALVVDRSVEFTNTTFSGNRTTQNEGGAFVSDPAYATLTTSFFDCTLADNSSAGPAGVGGAYARSSPHGATKFIYQGSLFAHNSALSFGEFGFVGVPFTLTSLGNNLSTDGVGMSGPGDIITSDPRLGTLGYYGGPTPTIPLLANSPALDAGATIANSTTDQRGVARPQGTAPDIGAFEVRPQQITLSSADQLTNVGEAFSRGGSVTLDGNSVLDVDYGDSVDAPPSPVALNSDGSFTLSHAYAAEGTYVVTVTLADAGGVWDTVSFNVDVFLAGVDTTRIHEVTTSGPGVVTVQATRPADGTSVTATLVHLSATNASLLVAIVPPSVAAALNGSSQIAGNTITSSYDVRAVNVGIDDNVVIVFHYFNDDFDQPVLRYYNRTTGQEGEVSSDTYVVDPVARTITVILDDGSVPGILDIGGTVFTIAVPLAVTVTPAAVDVTTVSALERGDGIGGGGFGAGNSNGGGSSGTASSSFQVTGNPTLVVVASLGALGDLADESSRGRSDRSDRANLLADLPVVPDSLITLPGPILTPGSAESPLPSEPPKVSTPPEGDAPATSRLDGPEDDVPDAAFARFDARKLALRSLPSWIEGEGGGTPADWRDTSLALAAFVAARPARPRRRPLADAFAER